jgi:hypothetical protein
MSEPEVIYSYSTSNTRCQYCNGRGFLIVRVFETLSPASSESEYENETLLMVTCKYCIGRGC